MTVMMSENRLLIILLFYVKPLVYKSGLFRKLLAIVVQSASISSSHCYYHLSILTVLRLLQYITVSSEQWHS
jgi:hypothetical protein